MPRNYCHQRTIIAVIGCSVAALLSSAFAGDAGSEALSPLAAEVNEDRLAADAVAVLKRHCIECHGPAQQEGSLRLDLLDAALRGGSTGPALIPHQPAESELLRRVHLDRDDAEAMPPLGPGLGDEEKTLLTAWINGGAPWPADANQPHWAYVPPVLKAPPSGDAAPRELVDGWIAAGHAKRGLAFAPRASPSTLVRRLSFDLTGLPPTPEMVEAFAADPSEEAYAALVDTLLASDEFGVRWARMWLDLARYADSHGFQRDDLRNLWAYRDWVVDALNADMPFDQFTREQIAGDLLPGASESSRIATGFHRCAPTNVEAGTDPEESRFNQVIDRVNTTAAVWLGTTLECAQCHDHKYDPFTQADYYRLAAFFNSTESEVARSNPAVPSSIKFLGPSLSLDSDPWADERASVRGRLQGAEEALKAAQEAKTVLEDLREDDASEADDDAEASINTSIASIKQSIKALTKERDEIPAAATLVMQEQEAARATFVLDRGDLGSPAEEVLPGTPTALPALTDLPPNRLGLADWLVNRANPLTARVIVNRLWYEIFGRGLVSTLEDFGVKGAPPSHPELLDSLAVRFMEDGWSLKTVLRQIVLSRTYQQEARAHAEVRSRDPENRWLARGPRFRLDAEAIRDNALAIAGLISLEKGGPSIRPPQPKGLWTKVGGEQYAYVVSAGESKYRRGLYVVLKRGSPYPGFVTFDATSRMTCVVQRARSNTPLQALVLLNDEVFSEAAIAFAGRILRERPEGSAEDRINHAFQLAVARRPTSGERDVLLALLARQQEALAAEPERAKKLLSPCAEAAAADGPRAVEWAAWYPVATALLNLDETISKP